MYLHDWLLTKLLNLKQQGHCAALSRDTAVRLINVTTAPLLSAEQVASAQCCKSGQCEVLRLVLPYCIIPSSNTEVRYLKHQVTFGFTTLNNFSSVSSLLLGSLKIDRNNFRDMNFFQRFTRLKANHPKMESTVTF